MRDLDEENKDLEYQNSVLLNEIYTLEDQLESSDRSIEVITTQLEIIVIPNMPQWALLLEIERSIEKMKKGI